MKLRYTRPAAIELNEVLTYLGQRSPQGAHRVQARIFAVTQLLMQHPEAGQLTRRRGMRRIVTAPYPYLVFYKIDGGEIVIHSIRHGARKAVADG